jgi:hypothetical protein
MLVLPLIRHALLTEGETSALGRRVLVQAEIRQRRLRVTVGDSSDGFGPNSSESLLLLGVRKRLLALGESSVTLTLRDLDAGSEAVLDLPVVAA